MALLPLRAKPGKAPPHRVSVPMYIFPAVEKYTSREKHGLRDTPSPSFYLRHQAGDVAASQAASSRTTRPRTATRRAARGTPPATGRRTTPSRSASGRRRLRRSSTASTATGAASGEGGRHRRGRVSPQDNDEQPPPAQEVGGEEHAAGLRLVQVERVHGASGSTGGFRRPISRLQQRSDGTIITGSLRAWDSYKNRG